MEACSSVSKDHIELLRIVGEGILLYLHLYEVLLSDAADRADLQGSVENSSADQAFYQPAAALLLSGIFLLQKGAAEVISVIIGVLQLVVIRLEAYPEAIHHPHPQLPEPLRQMGDRLAAPAVAAEGSRQFFSMGLCKHGGGQIPDGL